MGEGDALQVVEALEAKGFTATIEKRNGIRVGTVLRDRCVKVSYQGRDLGYIMSWMEYLDRKRDQDFGYRIRPDAPDSPLARARAKVAARSAK